MCLQQSVQLLLPKRCKRRKLSLYSPKPGQDLTHFRLLSFLPVTSLPSSTKSSPTLFSFERIILMKDGEALLHSVVLERIKIGQQN